MNNKAFYNLTYGVFLLATKAGEKANACIVNTGVQVAGSPVRVAVSVLNTNYTCALIKESGRFTLSALDDSCSFETIKHFGMQSGRDVDKLDSLPMPTDESGVPYLNWSTCARFSGKVTHSVDLGTHTLFIAEVTEAEVCVNVGRSHLAGGYRADNGRRTGNGIAAREYMRGVRHKCVGFGLNLAAHDRSDLLERLWDRYDREEFISADPIAVPHCFASRDDREIAGFLAATIAWGSRPMIVRNGLRMMHFLDDAPHDFVRNASERELAKLSGFVHRTFNGGDLIQFVRSIRAICERHGGLGRFVEASYASTGDMRRVLAAFREEFFRTEHPERCRKHVSSIERGASCKRLCMYFRWMVRHDDRGVDFGLWRTIPPSALYLPLDLHTGNMGRALGLLARRQNDWRAVEEITAALRTFDADDPVRYDFALFGAGIDGFLK